MNKEVLSFDDSIISEELPSEDILLEGRVENLEIENTNQQTEIESKADQTSLDDLQTELTEHKDNYNDTFIKDTLANIEAMARKEGRFYFATDEKIYLGDDGTELAEIGGGGSGLGTVSNEIVTTTIELPVEGALHKVRLSPSSAVTLSSTPFGLANELFIDGMVITLIGTSDTNTVTLEHNDIDYGLILNGNITLGKYAIITLAFDLTFKRFIEVSRNV